jgi:hypothetical protein
MQRKYESPIVKINSDDWRIFVTDQDQVKTEFRPPYDSGMDGWWPGEHYSTLMSKKTSDKVRKLPEYFEQQVNKIIGLPDLANELPLFNIRL